MPPKTKRGSAELTTPPCAPSCTSPPSSPQPQAETTASASTAVAAAAAAPHPGKGVLYFDAVHIILLSHIRRSNCRAVVALLALPDVGGDPLFWQTCTYRAGIVAAMVQYVMEHTGQTAIDAPAGVVGAVKKAQRPRANAAAATSSSSPPSPPLSWVVEGGTEDVTGLTAHSLHGLLHHCLYPGACCVSGVVVTQTTAAEAGAGGGGGSGGALSVSEWGRALAAYHCHTDDTRVLNWGREEDLDGAMVPPYLLPPQRHPERVMTNLLTDAAPRQYLESVVRELRRMISGTATATAAVNLAALVAVLQEHCASFTYVNPLAAAATAAVVAPQRKSDSHESPPQPVTTSAPVVAMPVQESLVEAVDASTAGADAVTMLQHLPALSATRWTLPAKATKSMISETAATEAPITEAPLQQQQQQKKQQRDAEQARVSAAIRAFDAFSEALAVRPQIESDDASGFVPAQRHRGAAASASATITTSSTSVTATTATTAQPHVAHQRSASTMQDLFREGPPQRVPPAAAPPPPPIPALTTAAAPACVIRRRNKFTGPEDAAIVHGVARFGQAASAFQYIFHAYRGVWHAGRTSTHLYDHWRDVLRRRTVESMEKAAQPPQQGHAAIARSEEEKQRGNVEPQGAADRSPPGKRARSAVAGRGVPANWASQELSSDIEDSSAE